MSRRPRTVNDVIRANLAAMSREAIADYAYTLESLLCERERVLCVIPECPAHGAGCVPWAVEWVEKKLDEYAPPLERCPGQAGPG